jgi:hypothetical protein
MTPLEHFAKRIAACDSKIAFKKKGAAMFFAFRRGFGSAAYRCPICGAWHLTSKKAND